TFGATAVNMGIPWAHGPYARVGGMFELVQKGMSRAGTVRGFTFELECVFTSIREFINDAGVDIILQFKILGKDGPDMLLVTATKVRIRQMKAYISVSAVYGWTGEAARQTGSDISRMIDAFGSDLDALLAKSGPLKLDVDLGEPKGTRELDSEWTFFVDGRRDAADLSASVQRNALERTDEMNAMFSRTGDSVTNHTEEFAQFCADATHQIAKDGPSIGETLIRASGRQANPPLSMAEVAILRLFLNEKTGLLSDEALDTLIKKARVAARFDPPLKITLDIRTKQHLKAGSFESGHAALKELGN
ncbi:MAG TPA: hypothetical protein VJ998_10740, partial [Pseudomonadales bacterium]|nr:hypothetical protein [Pseudomonadales bacterium]